MRSSGILRAALWRSGLTLLWAVANTAFAQSPTPDNPANHWKLTDRWQIIVEYYALTAQKDSMPQEPTALFPVNVFPAAGAEGDLSPLRWTILQFTPSGNAPEHLRTLFHAWMQKRTGWLGKATRTEPATTEPVDMDILQIGAASVLAQLDLAMPLEMLFPNLTAQTLTDPRTGTKFELKRDEKDGVIRMEATFRIPGKDEIRLNQTWGKGETWWRESTRYVNGRKTFHAQFVSYHSTAELEQRLRDDINLFLEDDDRLHVRLDFIRDNPKAQELLDAVQKATGVGLRVDPELRDYETPFGSVHFRNAPAWTVMKFIASQGFHNAQWERNAEGYRLKPYGTLPPKPEENRSFLLIFLRHGGATFILLLLLGLTIWTRRRAK